MPLVGISRRMDLASVAAARAAGNQWNYGTPGIGTVAHLGMELLKTKAGIAPVHVPYPGNPQIITAMLGGQVQLALLPPALSAAQVRGGKLRAIGASSTGRSPVAAEVPSLSEIGVKDYQLEIWNAVAAPNSLPKAHVNRLAALLTDIVRREDIRQKIFAQGWQVVGTSSEGLRRRIESDTAVMADVIQHIAVQAPLVTIEVRSPPKDFAEVFDRGALDPANRGVVAVVGVAAVGGAGLGQAALKGVVDACHLVPVACVAVCVKPRNGLNALGRAGRGAGHERQQRHHCGSADDQRPGRMGTGWGVNAHGACSCWGCCRGCRCT